jgi:hypothetical protein
MEPLEFFTKLRDISTEIVEAMNSNDAERIDTLK